MKTLRVIGLAALGSGVLELLGVHSWEAFVVAGAMFAVWDSTVTRR